MKLIVLCFGIAWASPEASPWDKALRGLSYDRHQPELWKQAGKLLMDGGEWAEAYRLFRAGALHCPDDDQLQHHARVYNAFHGQHDAGRTAAEHVDQLPPPAPRSSFLSVPVPLEHVPKAVVADAETGVVHASSQPILPRDGCRRIIDAALSRAATRGGWTTDRHVHAPTCDLAAYELDHACVTWLSQVLNKSLFPSVSSLFPRTLPDCHKLRCQDVFCVRYDGPEDEASESVAPGFPYLKAHQDESVVSLTIALNDMDDYQGGGLYLSPTGDVLNGEAGTVLCFAGGITHAGFPVERGTRWILTLFLYVDANSSGRKPGWALEAIENSEPVSDVDRAS